MTGRGRAPLRLLAALLLVVALLAGCTADRSGDLHALVTQVRHAAEVGDYARADGLLRDLQARVRALVASGDLDRDRAEEILAAAGDLDRAIAELVEGVDPGVEADRPQPPAQPPPDPPTPSPSPSPAAEPSPDDAAVPEADADSQDDPPQADEDPPGHEKQREQGAAEAPGERRGQVDHPGQGRDKP